MYFIVVFSANLTNVLLFAVSHLFLTLSCKRPANKFYQFATVRVEALLPEGYISDVYTARSEGRQCILYVRVRRFYQT